MGCDIHLGVEKRVNGKWERVNPPDDYPRDEWDKEQLAKHTLGSENHRWYTARLAEKWYGDRNYEAFAVLAGVRNYFDIEPIAEPRGWPADMSEALKERIDFRKDREIDDWLWFGDHTASWLTARELAEFDWEGQFVTLGGIVDWSTFEKFVDGDCKEGPSSYCQGIGGQSVVVLEQEDATRKLRAMRSEGLELPSGKSYHVRVSWSVSYATSAGRLYSRLLPGLVKLAGDDLDSVRIVFNFDS